MTVTKGQLFIVSAPSGAGKTSLVNALLERLSGIEVSVSHTTRAPRLGEVSGIDYNFIDQTGFQQIVDKKGFLEYATVFGNSYGTSKTLVEEKLAQGVDIVLEIDWQGAQQVRKVMKNCCSIFILPPSKQVLDDRLRGRGQDSEEVISKRMRTAVDEMMHYSEYDFLVVNDDFETALSELVAVVQSQRQVMQRGKQAYSTLINQLLN
ncbi:MAG: guanylate kinase [Cycloclasticus sp.]|nr:guanylate kinase [Cycloclasticus sp.]MDF1689415.1 guanylate kinase [Cycloclasticus sp.]MEE4291338.1 guanylate kinase [Cycloclasticus sp.]